MRIHCISTDCKSALSVETLGNVEKNWLQDNYELPKLNEVSITYSSSADSSTVSNYTESIIVDAMNESGNTSINVTSTARTPEAQANAMDANVKSKGMESQKKLYAAAGDKVLDKYPDKKAMVNKINEIGPGKVSKHCADPTQMNVLDVSVWRGGIQNPRSFATELENDSRVSKVLSPYNSTDPAIHIEVPQP